MFKNCFLVFLVFFFSKSVNAQINNLEIELLTRNAVEKEISQGETHYYRVDLTEGQFLYVDTQQIGIDVEVSLHSNGTKVAMANVPDLRYHPEPLYWIEKQRDGNYTIQINTSDQAKKGKYTVKIGDLRPVLSNDYLYVNGQKYLADACELRKKNSKADFQNAVELLKKSINCWNMIKQNERQGVCLNLIGEIEFYLGNTSEAINFIEQSLDFFPEVGSGRAQSFNNLGHISVYLENQQNAIDYFLRSINANKTDDKSITVNGLIGLGNAYSSLGKIEDALFQFTESLKLSRDFGFLLDESTALHAIGSIYYDLKQPQKAISFIEESLTICTKIGDQRNIMANLNALGSCYRFLQQYHKSIEYYTMVVELAEQTGIIKQKINALTNLGYLHFLKKEYSISIEKLTDAIALATKHKDVVQEAVNLRQIGEVYFKLGDSLKALEFYNKSLSLAANLDDVLLTANALYSRAELYKHLNELQMAMEDIEKALEMILRREVKFNRELKTLQSSSYSRFYGLQTEILMRLHSKDSMKGYAARALHVREKSKARAFLEFLKESKIKINNNEVDKHLLDQEEKVRQLIAENSDLLAKTSNLDEKMRLNNYLRQLDTEAEQIQAKIRKNNPLYAEFNNPNILHLEEIQQYIDDNTLILEYYLGDEKSYLWAITKNTFQSFELPKKVVVNELAGTIINYFKTRVPPDESSEQKNERLAQQKFFLKVLDDFSKLVLAQVSLTKKKILVVGDGILEKVPFSALLDPSSSRLLVLDHEIITVPSVSSFIALKSIHSQQQPTKVLVVSDPVFTIDDDRLAKNKEKGSSNVADNKISDIKKQTITKTENLLVLLSESQRDGLKRLSFASDEASAIEKIYQKSTTLLSGTSANLTSVLKEISKNNYSIVHFITHGFVDDFRPESSGLVFSTIDDKGEAQKAHLNASAIYNLKLNTDLVVLSACNTGFGQNVDSEGVVGLTRAFFYAGSKRVLLTLWNINDQSSSVLMSNFYSEMKKNNLNPSAALRKAQLTMLKDVRWSSPYYWAAFQLQGDF